MTLAAALPLLVLLAAACSSGGGVSFGDIGDGPASQSAAGDIDGASPADGSVVEGLMTTTASGVVPSDAASGSLDTSTDAALVALLAVDPVSQERFDEVSWFYDWYLGQRASAIDGTIELEEMNGLVTESGQAELAEAVAYNQGLHADGRISAVNEMWLFANIESISQVDDQTILVRDCTEQHEVNSFDRLWVYWVTNEVVIDVSTGEMRVAAFTTTHNGFLETDEAIGCAPVSFRERAEAAAAQGWTELTAWGRSPESRSDDNLSVLIGDPLRQRVLDAIDDNTTVEFDDVVEDVSFEATGLDTYAAMGVPDGKAIIVVVESCHRFPDGRSGTDLVTGASVSDLAAGAEQLLRFRVLLDPSRVDRVDQVISIDVVGNGCAS